MLLKVTDISSAMGTTLFRSISVRSNQVWVILLQVVHVLPGRQHRPHHGPTNLGLRDLLIASLDDALLQDL
jgi:hypothetical protein